MITRRDFFKIAAASGALASVGQIVEAKSTIQSAVPDEGFCHEGARKIPVIAEVDLVVAGGSSRAIAAAVAAAKTGSRVYRQQRTIPLQQLCNECADGPVR